MSAPQSRRCSALLLDGLGDVGCLLQAQPFAFEPLENLLDSGKGGNGFGFSPGVGQQGAANTLNPELHPTAHFTDAPACCGGEPNLAAEGFDPGFSGHRLRRICAEFALKSSHLLISAATC